MLKFAINYYISHCIIIIKINIFIYKSTYFSCFSYFSYFLNFPNIFYRKARAKHKNINNNLFALIRLWCYQTFNCNEHCEDSVPLRDGLNRCLNCLNCLCCQINGYMGEFKEKSEYYSIE